MVTPVCLKEHREALLMDIIYSYINFLKITPTHAETPGVLKYWGWIGAGLRVHKKPEESPKVFQFQIVCSFLKTGNIMKTNSHQAIYLFIFLLTVCRSVKTKTSGHFWTGNWSNSQTSLYTPWSERSRRMSIKSRFFHIWMSRLFESSSGGCLSRDKSTAW